VILQRRCDFLLGGDQQLGALIEQVEQRPEALHRQQLGDVRALARLGVPREGPRRSRDLGQLTVLGRELRRGRDLHLLCVAERALREGGEPAQRFDLDVEHVDPHGPVLRRREHVEQPAAHRELAPLLDLVDPLVARRDELRGALVEVE